MKEEQIKKYRALSVEQETLAIINRFLKRHENDLLEVTSNNFYELEQGFYLPQFLREIITNEVARRIKEVEKEIEAL